MSIMEIIKFAIVADFVKAGLTFVTAIAIMGIAMLVLTIMSKRKK